MPFRCAVLDDFQNVATTFADWSVPGEELEVVSFTEHFGDEDELAAALTDFDCAVTLRERVAFPASVFDRLPRLRLLIASGMRNSVIDYAAANANGVTVCGTESSSTPPVELTWALLLGLARGLVEESTALREGRIAGAGVDVFDVEPLPADHPMRTAPRLLATPHLGYVSRANYERYYGQAVEGVRAYLAGAPVRVLG
ncbi:NAD(P)-dependent oxidoreductase [Streptomyces sp. 3214.6]|uniref:NAD(P)-dependent oxidoreductase n=1 Tax=Streptomyces sp. 3214.6 TaxID=1882757 RepID=UPI00090CC633|nr:NAD(P)-dependent oxidoreductase [Streptomyces sp. 3214.6]SHI10378.1 D-isomer specific 2-hydroxyacid dehydrogenase, catalytic domain [Streptomyces sp. 3214.6]